MTITADMIETAAISLCVAAHPHVERRDWSLLPAVTRHYYRAAAKADLESELSELTNVRRSA